MEKTNKKILEEIIRVDHAGERGAIKIYEGQLLALKTIKQDESLKEKIELMKEHELEHLEYFEKEIQKRNVKPTRLLPLWEDHQFHPGQYPQGKDLLAYFYLQIPSAGAFF